MKQQQTEAVAVILHASLGDYATSRPLSSCLLETGPNDSISKFKTPVNIPARTREVFTRPYSWMQSYSELTAAGGRRI